MPQESLLEFPCEFQIKAMGLNEPDFESHVRHLIQGHLDPSSTMETVLRPSRGNKYLSVSCRIIASDRAQLDAIYRDLSADKRVLVAL